MPNARKKILVLDDGMFYRVLLTLTLTEQGYKTISFANKIDGCEWLQSNLPDLIISDIEAPGLSGFEFVKILKANGRLKDVPIIFISSCFSRNAETVKKAKRLGALVCLAKPFTVEQLLMRVEGALAER
jgi:DNA-binding response OmpR family regulator